MKNLILPFFAIALIWTACSNTDLPQLQETQELTWTVSDIGDPNIVQEINSTRSLLVIEMEPNTLCGGHGVKLTIEVESNSIFESSINTFPFAQTFDVNQNDNIKITTEYNDSGALFFCDIPTIIDIKATF